MHPIQHQPGAAIATAAARLRRCRDLTHRRLPLYAGGIMQLHAASPMQPNLSAKPKPPVPLTPSTLVEFLGYVAAATISGSITVDRCDRLLHAADLLLRAAPPQRASVQDVL